MSPCYRDRCSSNSLYLSISGGNTDDIKEEEGKPTKTIRGTCRHHCVITFPLTFTSSGERPGRHGARGCPHSCRWRKGGRRWIQSPPSHPGSYLRRLCEIRSSLTIPCSKFFLMDLSTGSNCRQKQNRRSPLPCGRIGGRFLNTSR